MSLILKTDDILPKSPGVTPSGFRSDQIDKISGALAKAQGLYKQLDASQVSPGGPYANLHDTLASVRSALAENGLSFTQHTILSDDGSGPKILETVLLHSSGQWIASQERIVPGSNWRSTGNIIEIVKRIQAQMLLGVAPSDNDPIAFDDGGEEQAQLQLIDELKVPTKSKKLDREETITNEQYHELLAELDGYSDIAADILSAYKLESLADLPKSVFYKVKASTARVKKHTNQYLERK